MNTWGERIKLSIFGESHGPAIGIVIDGLPAGLVIDDEYISRMMARRAPGRDELSTPRKEADEPRIISGLVDGVTTGAPLCCVIGNTDVRPGDYDTALRPGHADWTMILKYGGFADRSGGGHFSGRLTAPIVFAGAIAKQILEETGIYVCGRIKSIGGREDNIDLTVATGSGALAGQAGLTEPAPGGDHICEHYEDLLRVISEKDFPADDQVCEDYKSMILSAKSSGDSIGGAVEVVAFGEIGGFGEPFFGSVESRLASLLFSVPAVKAVEFGKGVGFGHMNGSDANDPLRMRGGRIVSVTNNNGGVLGGIATGMPLIVRATIKPTASIAIPQETVDPVAMRDTIITVGGRHDPCIVPRAVPVIEACVAICLLDLMLCDRNN